MELTETYEEIPEISGKLLDDHTLEEEKMVSNVFKKPIHIERLRSNMQDKNMNLIKIEICIQTILL